MTDSCILVLFFSVACIRADFDQWQILNRGVGFDTIAVNNKALYGVTTTKELHVLKDITGFAKVDSNIKDVSVNDDLGIWMARPDYSINLRSGVSSSNLNGTGWTTINGEASVVATGRYGVILVVTVNGTVSKRAGISSAYRSGSSWYYLSGLLATKASCNRRVCFIVTNSGQLQSTGLLPNIDSPPYPAEWTNLLTDTKDISAYGEKTVWRLDASGNAWEAVNVLDSNFTKVSWERRGYQSIKFKDIAVTDKLQYAIGTDNHARLLTGCPIFDFEENDLSRWKKTGTAFLTQPVVSQPTFYKRPSGKVGDRLIDTYSSRKYDSVAESAPEATQGDALTGTLISPSFQIRTKMLHFVIGGGSYPLNYVALVVDNEENLTSSGASKNKTGPNGPIRSGRYWMDVTSYMGKCAKMKLVDEGTNFMGHTIFDDLRASPPCFNGMQVLLKSLNHDGKSSVGNIVKYRLKINGFYTSETRPLSVKIMFPIVKDSSLVYIEKMDFSKKCSGSVTKREHKNSSSIYSERWHTITTTMKSYLLSDAEYVIEARIYDHDALRTALKMDAMMEITVNYVDEYVKKIHHRIEVSRHGNETAKLEHTEGIGKYGEYKVGTNVTYNVSFRHNYSLSQQRAYNVMIRLLLPPYMTLLCVNGLQKVLGDVLLSTSLSQHTVRIPELLLDDNRTITFVMRIAGNSLWNTNTKMKGEFLVDDISFCPRRNCRNAHGNGTEIKTLIRNKFYQFTFSYGMGANPLQVYTKIVAEKGAFIIVCKSYGHGIDIYRGNCFYGNTSSNNWHKLNSMLSNVSYYHAEKKEIYGVTIQKVKLKLFGKDFLETMFLPNWDSFLTSESSSLVQASVAYENQMGMTYGLGSVKHQLNCCSKD